MDFRIYWFKLEVLNEGRVDVVRTFQCHVSRHRRVHWTFRMMSYRQKCKQIYHDTYEVFSGGYALCYWSRLAKVWWARLLHGRGTMASIPSVGRVDSRFAPSEWETALLCNDVSHRLGASLESALSGKWDMASNTLFAMHLCVINRNCEC